MARSHPRFHCYAEPALARPPPQVQALVKELEGRYPGAKVRATVTAQAMGQPGDQG